MGGRVRRAGAAIFWTWIPPVVAALAATFSFGAEAVAQMRAVFADACRVEVVEGEVWAGQKFEHPIGGGLKVSLEPIASGWILRVLPTRGPRGEHDYAELATPPYHSVSPLSVSTDFSFRAQDALAWNPRRFHFAADRKAFAELLRQYDEYQANTRDVAAHRAVEVKLADIAAQSPEGELTLLDAHLVQGTADQAGTAALVASHLNASAHEVDQPTGGRSMPLGHLNWIRFRLRLDLRNGFQVPAGAHIESGRCL